MVVPTRSHITDYQGSRLIVPGIDECMKMDCHQSSTLRETDVEESTVTSMDEESPSQSTKRGQRMIRAALRKEKISLYDIKYKMFMSKGWL